MTRREHHALAPEPVTAASVIGLLDAIERYEKGALAALAFRAALASKGREIAAAGGPTALTDMLARISAADPDRADAREAVITAAWADLLPSSCAGARA